MTLTRYVTVSELIYINGTLLGSEAIASGKQQVRDIARLEAAAARPAASAFGADAYPDLSQKAAALLHSLARNHPFTDGNKRTAVVGMVFMLWVNGFAVTWDQSDALAHVLRAAQGMCDVDTLAAWLRPIPFESGAVYPLSPDEESDKFIIAAILAAQAWLLNALERQ